LNAGAHRFPRSSRLTNAADFQRVFARPKVSQDRAFRVLSRRNGLPHSRLGLAVSTRVCKQATGRNRLKRLIRESFRKHQGDLGRSGGLDIVVLPSRHAATMCNEELTRALSAHWRRCVEQAAHPERTRGKQP